MTKRAESRSIRSHAYAISLVGFIVSFVVMLSSAVGVVRSSYVGPAFISIALFWALVVTLRPKGRGSDGGDGPGGRGEPADKGGSGEGDAPGGE